jgi:hypothetical protein
LKYLALSCDQDKCAHHLTLVLARIDNTIKLIYILTLTQFGIFWKLIYIYPPNRLKDVSADTLKLIDPPNNGKINKTFTLPYTLCRGIIGGPQAGRHLPFFRWDIYPVYRGEVPICRRDHVTYLFEAIMLCPFQTSDCP